MKNTWLSSRKDVFLRDLFRDFIDANTNFIKIRKKYKEFSFVPFKMMDSWVGTETKKGPLCNLKDQSHMLFRNSSHKTSLYEHLFDWTIGSIFHEAIKLKEDSYQIDSYKPLLDLEINNYKNNKGLSEIINEYFALIEKANKNLKEDVESIDELFSKAVFHIHEIFLANKDNTLLLRFWLDNKKKVENIFGLNSFNNTLARMFPNGIHEAYLQAADNCSFSGRHIEAEKYIRKAVRLDPKSKTLRKLLKEVKEKDAS